ALGNQDGWSVLGNSSAVTVQSTVVAKGSQAVLIDTAVAKAQTGPYHAAVTNPSDTVVSMEADVRLSSSTVPTAWQFSGMSSPLFQFIGGFNVLPDGRLQIITAGFPLTVPVISRDIWNHYAVFYNFSAQTFDIYINGALIARN